MSETEGPQALRLDRLLAQQVGCSRAEAQQYIEGGWVRVGREIVEEPQRIVEGERIELASNAQLGAAEPATILLNKPAGVAPRDAAGLLAPDARWEADSSGIRLLQRHFRHLEPVALLEHSATGLLVLTQDGRVRRRLTEDYASLEQEFVVDVDGQVADGALERLMRAQPPGACKISWQNEVRLRFAIKNVRPGQLADLCMSVGLRATAIRRLRIGRVALSKMPEGAWRYLPVGERF